MQTAKMLGKVPRRLLVSELEVLLVSRGYRVSKEPFQIAGIKEMDQRRRLHAKVETFGEDRVPKGTCIDLHIDLMPEVRKYHKSIVEGPIIQKELESIISLAREGWSLTDVVPCGACGRQIMAKFLQSHWRVHHPSSAPRRPTSRSLR